MTDDILSAYATPRNTYRLALTVSPILPREVQGVLEVYMALWGAPEQVDRRVNGETVTLVLVADHEIHAGQSPSTVAASLANLVWRRLDRYVKITIETTYLSTPPDSQFEFGEPEYAKAFSARFQK